MPGVRGKSTLYGYPAANTSIRWPLNSVREEKKRNISDSVYGTRAHTPSTLYRVSIIILLLLLLLLYFCGKTEETPPDDDQISVGTVYNDVRSERSFCYFFFLFVVNTTPQWIGSVKRTRKYARVLELYGFRLTSNSRVVSVLGSWRMSKKRTSCRLFLFGSEGRVVHHILLLHRNTTISLNIYYSGCCIRYNYNCLLYTTGSKTQLFVSC